MQQTPNLENDIVFQWKALNVINDNGIIQLMIEPDRKG
jgi:hypothetical protein